MITSLYKTIGRLLVIPSMASLCLLPIHYVSADCGANECCPSPCEEEECRPCWKNGTFCLMSVLGAVAGAGVASANRNHPKRGHVGEEGEMGDPGRKGANGPSGAAGTAGTSGATGVTGATGPVGATGATGAVGATGSTGATGATGSAGADFTFDFDAGETITFTYSVDVANLAGGGSIIAFVTSPDGTVTQGTSIALVAGTNTLPNLVVTNPEFGSYTVGVQVLSNTVNPPLIFPTMGANASRDGSVTVVFQSLGTAVGFDRVQTTAPFVYGTPALSK